MGTKRLRPIAVLLLIALLIGACGAPPQAAAPTPEPPTMVPTATPTPLPTSTPTPIPTPTPLPTIAADVKVAGTDVGTLTADEARVRLDSALAAALRPLELRVEDARLVIDATDIDLTPDYETMLAAALKAPSGVQIPLTMRYDEALLDAKLDELAAIVDVPATYEVITGTQTFSRSFALGGGLQLDRAAAIAEINRRLNVVGANRRITLTPVAAEPDPEAQVERPDAAVLQREIEALAKQWKGVVGIYVYDLDSGEEIASLNKNTVFSGASVMKAIIMLNTYLNSETFSKGQETWLRMMIEDSDNYSANSLLSVAAGGGPTDTDAALQGALAMSEMLAEEFGLKHTYQNMPYEAYDYLVKLRGVKIKRGPAQEGEPPYTDADPVLRTTPYEMSQVFRMIYECSQGSGFLLEEYGEQLTAERCQEMIARLDGNKDLTRMKAGIPKDVPVAHKSGWIEDMQSDVGLVRSPGGNYLAAIYVYTDIRGTGIFLTDKVATPAIAGFSRLIYTFYNPVRTEEPKN